MSECLKPGHPDPLCPHHSHASAQNPTCRRVWSKKSRNRKYCRERAKFTLKYKKRRPIGIEDPRKVKTDHYYRRSVDVLTADGRTLTCLAYLYPATSELLALPPRSSYSEDDHAAYRPPLEPNPEIVRLCRVPGHGLATTRPHTMRTHCLRLLPGDDILGALKQFVADRSLGAAAVLSAVGSTGKTTLRPAGSPAPREFDGKFEVVSLSGTLDAGRHHLHMSISDAECRTFGGHLMAGCEVRTTLEVVLGAVEGVEFSRLTDLRTGYDELSIAETGVYVEESARVIREGDGATPPDGESVGTKRPRSNGGDAVGNE